MIQCAGTTHAGHRCKIKQAAAATTSTSANTATVWYCHHHNTQTLQSAFANLSLNPPAKPAAAAKASGTAYIYVYTLEPGHPNVHVFQNGAFVPLNSHRHSHRLRLKSWLFRTSSTSTSTNASGRGAKKARLIKVGYTTQTPVKRLAQWKSKCQHPIFLLGPGSTSPDHAHPNNNNNNRKRNNNAYLYDSAMQGWPTQPQTAKAVESQIHAQLWLMFGKGSVVCEGCTKSPVDGLASQSNPTNKHHDQEQRKRNVHLEWFLVPDTKQALEQVYGVIQACIEMDRQHGSIL